ncbi:MAG TPA: hypothetical protein ENN09_02715 [Planctomycetes bacterium]|nr:hypothetical protein [Planctomycetota bacterium]
MPEKNGDIELAAAVAAASSMLQVVFLRGLMAVGGGNELLLGAILAGYLVWLSAGARFWVLLRRPASPNALLIIFIAAAVVEMLLVRLIGAPLRLAAAFAGGSWLPGAAVPMRFSMSFAFFIGAPSGIAAGMLFPLIVSRSADVPGAVGRIYAAEAGGHVAGLLAVTFALAFGAPDAHVMLFIPAAALAGCLMPRKRRAALAAAAAAAGLLAGPFFESATRGRGGLLPQRPFAVKSSAVREVALVGSPGEFTLYSDGCASSAYPPAGMYAPARLGTLAAKRSGSALVLSGDLGVAAIVAEAGFPAAFTAHLDAAPLQLMRRSGGIAPHVLQAAENVIYGDPLRTLLGFGKASLSFLYVELPDPVSISANRYHTLEFQRSLARALGADGIAVVCFALPSGGHEGLSEALTLKVFSTVSAAFPDVLAFDDDGVLVFFASPEIGVLGGLLDAAVERATASDDPAVRSAGMWAHLPRHDAVRRFLSAAPLPSPDTLRRPHTFLKRLNVESAFDAPAHRKRPRRSASSAIPVSLAAVFAAVLAFSVITRHGRTLAACDAFAAGMLTMGVEMALLFAYQARRGMMYLFTAAGVAAFMAGFSAGAALASRREAELGPEGARSSSFLPVAAALMALGYLAALPGEPYLTEVLLVVMLLAAGGACGYNLSLLPAAVAGDRTLLAASVNAGDNFGAAVGAALMALFLVPSLGLSWSLVLLLSLKSLSAAAVILQERF